METKINYEAMTDEEVVAEAQKGDKAAQTYLVNKYKPFVEIRSVPYFIAGAERDDLVQEGLIGLYKAVKTYNGTRRANFKTFAEVCVVRQMITAVKTSTRKKNSPLNYYVSIHSTDDELDLISAKLVDTKHKNPESIIIEREAAQGIENRINSVLSDFEAEVLRYYLTGISYKEISMLIGKTPKAVDNAMCRIKKKIEKYI